MKPEGERYTVPLIEEPPAQARRKLAAYRGSLRRRASAEYAAIASGYEALAAGKRLLHLANAVAAGGWDDQGRPRLAIARADRRLVRFSLSQRWARSEARVLFDARSANGRGNPGPSLVRSVELKLMPPERPGWEGHRRARAIVPLIPADVRPATGQEKDWYVFFEAEWSVVAPVDPYLLKHLHGELYVVLAEWALTPLEQAVLMGRMEGR